MTCDGTLHNPPAFYRTFVLELGRRHWPRYGTLLWKISLRIACETDAYAYRELERHKVEQDYDQWVSISRAREPSGTWNGIVQLKSGRIPRERAEIALSASVDRACSAWLAGRGLPSGDFRHY